MQVEMSAYELQADRKRAKRASQTFASNGRPMVQIMFISLVHTGIECADYAKRSSAILLLTHTSREVPADT